MLEEIAFLLNLWETGFADLTIFSDFAEWLTLKNRVEAAAVKAIPKIMSASGEASSFTAAALQHHKDDYASYLKTMGYLMSGGDKDIARLTYLQGEYLETYAVNLSAAAEINALICKILKVPYINMKTSKGRVSINIENAWVTHLPDYFHISGNVIAKNSKYFIKTGKHSHIGGYLDATGSSSFTHTGDYSYIGRHFNVSCFLNLEGHTSFTHTGRNSYIGGCLNAIGCTSFSHTGRNSYIHFDLDIQGCTSFNYIGDKTYIGGNVYAKRALSLSKYSFPDDIKMGGTNIILPESFREGDLEDLLEHPGISIAIKEKIKDIMRLRGII